MASSTPTVLSAAKEAEAQALAQRIRELAEDEIVQMARLLVSKPEREIFGETEFQLRDIVEEAAQKVLPELAGLHLSESTVQRTTEATGERLGTLLDQGKVLGGPTPWPWHPDAQGKTCAYISVDATGVRQQAKGGGPAE